MMFRYSSRLVCWGLVIGLVLAVWIAKLIAVRTMYIAVYDAPAYMVSLAIAGAVAVAASIPPAVRASRADPMPVLRLD
jgi:ABC-type antimicrobial peptide transport system permease subunit